MKKVATIPAVTCCAPGAPPLPRRDLAGEELEEPVELVRVAPERGGQLGGVLALRRLDGAHLELQAVSEAVDPAEHTDGVALREASVEQLDVAPDARLDPAARIDELEREVRRARARAEALLLRDRVDTVDDAVLLELRDRRHGPSLGRRTDGTVARRGRDQAVSSPALRRAAG